MKTIKNAWMRTQTHLLRALFALPFLASHAFAQSGPDTEAFTDLQIFTTLCDLMTFMTGPIVIILGLIVLGIGGLMLAYGKRGAVGFLITAGIGIVVAVSAEDILELLGGVDAATECSGGSGGTP